MRQRIEDILQKNLNPIFLEVENQSHLHKGHMGDDGSGETHFEVRISSDNFLEISRIEAHRQINKLLKNEFDNNGLHALAIKIVK